jgi:L-asparaginase
MLLLAGDTRNSGTGIAWDALRAGARGLEAMRLGIRAVESNVEDNSVGRGGYPNALGEVELDAGVMEGRTRRSGAVGGLRGFLHPVDVAYAVMERLPHVLLVGEGAARFADEIAAERGDLLTEAMRAQYARWRAARIDENGEFDLIEAARTSSDPGRKDETTVYLTQDAQGDIAVATSTSGWSWKYPGRLGDTPIAGAGFYADNRYGAAACMGKGELAIRAGLARMTVMLMALGRAAPDAAREALRDVLLLPDVGDAELQLHAIDARGGWHVAYIGGAQAGDWHYAYVAQDGDAAPRRVEAERVTPS